MDKYSHIIIVVFACVLFSFSVQAEQEKESVKIGAILPLSGDASFWGSNSKNAIELALEDVSKQSNVNVEMIYEDEECEPRKAVAAIKKLISVDKVQAVIGAICSSSTLAIAPIAERNNVLLLSPCSEADDITNAGDYIFRTWPAGNKQMKALAKHAWNNLKFKTVGVLYIENDYGVSLAEEFKKAFSSLGGKISAYEGYPSTETDFRAQLTKIKAHQPEGLLLAGYIADGIAAVRQVKELGLNTTILGVSTHNSPDFLTPVGKHANGMYIADLEDLTAKEFKSRYEKTYSMKWPGNTSCASVAYDDVKLLVAAISKHGYEATKIKDYLYSVKEFKGVSGPITFDSNGDLVRGHLVFKIQDGKLIPVS